MTEVHTIKRQNETRTFDKIIDDKTNKRKQPVRKRISNENKLLTTQVIKNDKL